jgi:heptosyltransferase-2
MRRALIVKLGAIGDVVMAIPAAHQLLTMGYAVDWIAGTPAASVLACYPDIHTIPVDERAILHGSASERLAALRTAWRQLRGKHYDFVATLYYDRRYRLLSLPVMGARHVRLVRGDRRLELHQGRHHTDEFARILRSAALETAQDTGPAATSLSPIPPGTLPPSPLPASGGRRRITLAPGGARNLLRDDFLRRWQTEHYVALATMLLHAGHEVVLTGGPDDVWVREAFAGLPCIDLIDMVTLPELMALFEASDAVVTHDTGPLHLAGVTSCALLGIFGPVTPWARLPRRPGTMALWGGEGFACRPCYNGDSYADCADNQCMAQVTPAMAMEALTELLVQRDMGLPQAPSVRRPSPAAPHLLSAELLTLHGATAS